MEDEESDQRVGVDGSGVDSGGGIALADLTADQFGAAPVIVTPADDPRYGAHTQDTATPEAIAARLRTVDELWRDWLARPRS